MKKLTPLLALFPVVAIADVPHTFEPGTPAKASEVNANFAHTEAKADSNTSAISTLNTQLETVKQDVTTNQASVAANTASVAANTEALSALTTTNTANGAVIALNGESITTNTSGISDNAAAIAANETAIADNETAVAALTSTLSTLATQADVDASISAIEARVALIESVSDTAVESEAAELNLDVDCTDDGYALVTAYHANFHYTNVNFAITGECYGDIYAVPGTGENDIPLEYTQYAGQTVTIFSQDPDNRASIVPHPITNSAFLYPALHGGLYLNNIDIVAAENDWPAVMFSRNSHGSVSNVNFSNASMAIMAQEGAQVYLSENTFTNVRGALYARNGAVIRMFGHTAPIETQFIAIELLTGSSVNQQGDITVNSIEAEAIKMEASTWNTPWSQDGYTLTTQGTVSISAGSTLKVDHQVAEADIYIEQSTYKVGNMLDVGNAHLAVTKGSSFDAGNLNVRDFFLWGSYLSVNDNFTAAQGGSVEAGKLRVQNTLDAANARLDVTTDSSVIAENLNVNNFYFNDSYVRVNDSFTAFEGGNIDGGSLRVNNQLTTGNNFSAGGAVIDIGTADFGGNDTYFHFITYRGQSLNASSHVNFEGSTVTVDNLEAGELSFKLGTKAMVHGAVMATRLNTNDGSFVSVGNGSLFETVHVSESASLRLSGSDVTDVMHISDNSYVGIYNTALTANEINLNNSRVKVYSDNGEWTSPDKFRCNGLSVLDHHNWGPVNWETGQVDRSTNCADSGMWNYLMEHHINTNFN